MNFGAPLVQRTGKSLSIVLGGGYSRQLARTWVDGAPDGWVVTLEHERRSLGQSDKFWTICSLLAQSANEWDGERRSKDEWHDLLLHGWMIATGQHPRLAGGLEGGRVAIGLSTRRLSKTAMGELLDYSIAWAISHGIEMTGDA